jgi:hypothetical protein
LAEQLLASEERFCCMELVQFIIPRLYSQTVCDCCVVGVISNFLSLYSLVCTVQV